ncbi:MAG: glycosyltransferase [Thermoanaerobaculaceae bacterium]
MTIMGGSPGVAAGSATADRPLALVCGRSPAVGLVTYDPAMPSFRLRMAAMRPLMEGRGIEVRTIALGRGREWLRVVRLAGELRSCDLLIFQQVKLLAGERAYVNRLCRSWILDVDDAIMFRRPRRTGEAPSQAGWRRRRFRRMAERCQLVVAGSRSLADMIGPAARCIEVLHTPVDLAAQPQASLPPRERVRLAWIGLGSNLCYLEGLEPVLHRLRTDGVDFELRVISDRLPQMAGIPCVHVPWSASGEGTALASCDVGLAPLADDPWTRGKAGFRCIQYAAAGLPTVASPAGANREVVIDGETGILAGSHDEWHTALLQVCCDAGLRQRLGKAARLRADRFELAGYARRYIGLIGSVIGPRGRQAR